MSDSTSAGTDVNTVKGTDSYYYRSLAQKLTRLGGQSRGEIGENGEGKR